MEQNSCDFFLDRQLSTLVTANIQNHKLHRMHFGCSVLEPMCEKR